MSHRIGFVDTDIQIFRRHPDPRLKNAAETAIKSYDLVGTSTYAKLEFKRNHLRDLAYLWNKLRKVSGLAELYPKLSKLTFRQKRKLGRILDGLGRITKKVEDRGIRLTEAERIECMLTELENIIEIDWERFDHRSQIDYLVDGTGCVRAQEPPKIASGERMEVSIPQCRRDRILCRVHDFFIENRSDFEAVRDAITSLESEQSERLTAELSRFKLHIETARTDSTHLCDDRICAKLGDVLIAVDGKAGNPQPCPELLSSNQAEYGIVCPAINMPYNTFVKPRENQSPTGGDCTE